MPEERERRKMSIISRSDFAQCRKMNRELKKLADERDELLERICDESKKDWWPDKINLRYGFVEVGDEPGKVIREKLSKEDRAALKAHLVEVEEVQERLSARVVKIATANRVPTTCINLGSGEIEDVECDFAMDGDNIKDEEDERNEKSPEVCLDPAYK